MDTLVKLGELLATGEISRRDFIVQAIAAGLTVSAASTLAKQVEAATPKQGGRYRTGIGSGSTSDSLDPAIQGPYLRSVSLALRNCLIEIGPHGELIPELAESWETSDATTWAFKIRKGVEFHNGRTLTSNDVVASINHHRGEKSKSPAKALVSAVKDLKADGDNIVVTLDGPNVNLPPLFSFWQLGIMQAKDDGTIDWESGIATGGYSLVSFEPGVRTLLKRNPNYWKEGRAHFDDAEVLVINDTNARTNALSTSEIDSMDAPDLKTVDRLATRPGIKVDEVTGKMHKVFVVRTDRHPFDNNDVRLALKLAINRQALVDTVLSGHGMVGNDQPIGPSSPNFASELPQREYDPDKAKYHLKQAGMDSLTVDLKVADAGWGGYGAIDAATLYKEHAKKAGITINVVRVPDDGYWADYAKWDFRASYWAGRPTDDMIFSTTYAAGSPENETFWNNKKFNQLLVAARSELDDKKRRDMYVEMQRLVRDDGGAVIPIFVNLLLGRSDKVEHGDLASDWEMDGGRHIERWWFA